MNKKIISILIVLLTFNLCACDKESTPELVPEENLMGRAIFRIWSIDNGVKLWEPWLWLQNIRYSRLLTKIK